MDVQTDESDFIGRCPTKTSMVHTKKHLQYMYWLPKLHKRASKARFIVPTAHCSLKPLPKAVASALKILYKQIEAYHTNSFFFSVVQTFYPAQNNKTVFTAINKSNNTRRQKQLPEGVL